METPVNPEFFPIRNSRLSFINNGVAQTPIPLDFHLAHITLFHPQRRLAREAHAAGRSRNNDIADFSVIASLMIVIERRDVEESFRRSSHPAQPDR